MAENRWDNFKAVKELAEKSGEPAVAEKVDRILSAAMESIADVLPTATPEILRTGVVAAREALEAYERLEGVDELSPSFAAGRLASAVDALGYCAMATADEGVLQLSRMQPYGRIMAMLADGPTRSVDLAKRLGSDEAQVSKWLASLRDGGAVLSHKHGRELVSALTPIGRLAVETGWQDERRAPLEASNVVSLAASRYDLGSRAAPMDVEASEVPRISASGG